MANIDDRGTLSAGDDRIDDSSSRGSTAGGRRKPDIAAPGTDIHSLAFDSDGILSMTGTSMAAPHIAGAAALLRQAGIPNSLAVKAVLINTAGGSGWAPESGWGAADLTRALAVGNYFSGIAAPAGKTASVRFYGGRTSGALKATLVWNRHIVSGPGYPAAHFHDLDLLLYNRTDGKLLDHSDLDVSNVEQVRATTAGDVVLKVAPASATFGGGITAEPYALAVTEPGFAAMTGPSPGVSCPAPPAVQPGAVFTLSCDLANSGDLDVFNATVTVTPSIGSAVTGSAGSLAPGAHVARAWSLTAPSGAGRFSIAIALAASSWGENYGAATTVSITVDNGAPALYAGDNSLSLWYRAGDPAPSRTVSVTASAASVVFTTSVNASWLTVTPSVGSTPGAIQIGIDPAKLAPGAYRGTVAITAPSVGNSPQTVRVLLTVDQPSFFSTGNRVMTKAIGENACTIPTPADVFLPTDARAVVWFTVDNTLAGDIPAVRWQTPAGDTYATEVWDPIRAPGSWCLWAWMDIAGQPAADLQGQWAARVSWNGSAAFDMPFSIEGGAADDSGAAAGPSGTGAIDGVQHAVDERHRVFRGKTAGQLQRFVDHDGRRR